MKKLLMSASLAFVLASCSADYDTFGESDYNTMDDIGFVDQEGSVSVYSGEHRIQVALTELEDEDAAWDSVEIDFVNMSHFATLHLVKGDWGDFPTDSAALDSLAREVSYVGKSLKSGDKIKIPESKEVYVVVVSESGVPSIWKIEFDVPEAKPASSSSKKAGSSSTAKSSSSTKASSSSMAKSSDSKDEPDDEKPDDDEPDDEDSDESSAPEIISLGIAGVSARLDSVETEDGMNYHFHVDSVTFRADLTDLEVTELTLSEGASCDIELNETYDFSDNKTVTVTNEDGAKKTYTVKAGYQLPGSDFNSWNKNDPKPDSIWNNANTIVTTTTKYASGSMIGAMMETTEVLSKVASGSLYTADFNPNGVGTLAMASAKTWPDGNELINFGRKFNARPEYVEFVFSYTGKTDSCDLYVLLENRTGDKNTNRSSSDVNKLVASAWYRSTSDDNSGRENPDVVSVSEKDANGMRTIRLKLTYGDPLEGSPIENSSIFAESLRSSEKKAINNALVQGDGTEAVTHIRVVMASSAAGNFYNGIKGATLIVDELRLIY
ncbi:MAG: PCMD domain-containing protein [Fibrobacter sp.]|nr:PCMD domain-containing protein [Fibrobacter sp.]